MEPHPDFVGVSLPRSFPLGRFHLTPLSPEHVEEDFAAVMASAPVLTDIFGDWPNGLTLSDNLIDLAWHEREFTASRSFSWIIRDARQTYIGCFYVFPSLGTRGAAQAALWLCDMPDRVAVAQDLYTALRDWCRKNLPVGIALTWNLSPDWD